MRHITSHRNPSRVQKYCCPKTKPHRVLKQEIHRLLIMKSLFIFIIYFLEPCSLTFIIFSSKQLEFDGKNEKLKLHCN